MMRQLRILWRVCDRDGSWSQTQWLVKLAGDKYPRRCAHYIWWRAAVDYDIEKRGVSLGFAAGSVSVP